MAEGQTVLADILPQFLRPAGYEVFVASNGQKALDLIRTQKPHLIIVDCDLDIIDGFSLCQTLKSDFLTAYIPIIILIEKRQLRKRLLTIKEGIDDYILKPPDPIDLQVRLELALRRTEHQMHANSLSGLPGNKAIEYTARQRLKQKTPFAFVYLDIDNFKAFNDTYGYLRGDGVIMQTARILSDCVLHYGNKTDFVGHVGGDDFVIMTEPENVKNIAKAIIKEFNRLIPFHYNQEDRIAGHLVVKDRQNNLVKTPLMGISIAIVDTSKCTVSNIIELTELASEIKKHLKTLPGSKYLINRRTEKNEVIEEDSLYCQEIKGFADDEDIAPLGQLLLRAKLIGEKELREALIEHWSSRELLGQTLVRLGYLEEQDLAPFLSKASPPEKVI